MNQAGLSATPSTASTIPAPYIQSSWKTHVFTGIWSIAPIRLCSTPRRSPPSLWTDFSSNLQQRTINLLGSIINGSDYHELADQILQDLADSHPLNIETLKQLLVLFVECIYSSAQNLGIKVNSKELCRNDFRTIFDSLHLREARVCLHRILNEEHSQIGPRTVQRQLDTALQYISDNLADAGLTLERCARAVQCSTSALNKVFRRQQITSVAKYIRDVRLKNAFQMLQKGVSVSATSVRCGFGSTETFHPLFKERYGITPGQLRGGNEASYKNTTT